MAPIQFRKTVSRPDHSIENRSIAATLLGLEGNVGYIGRYGDSIDIPDSNFQRSRGMVLLAETNGESVRLSGSTARELDPQHTNYLRLDGFVFAYNGQN